MIKVKYYGEIDYARNLYYEDSLCNNLAFLERYRQYEDDEEYKARLLENYNEHIFQVIDMFPDFLMRLKLDKKNGKVIYGADIQSVFDIYWYTFARMVADVAPPVDDDFNYFESLGSILSCLACGKYFDDIRVTSYIAIVGTAKPSAIARTGEQAMLGRRQVKLQTRNKKASQPCQLG